MVSLQAKARSFLCLTPKHPKQIVLHCLFGSCQSCQCFSESHSFCQDGRTLCPTIRHFKLHPAFKSTIARWIRQLTSGAYTQKPKTPPALLLMPPDRWTFLGTMISTLCCPALLGHHLVFSSYLLQVLPGLNPSLCECRLHGSCSTPPKWGPLNLVGYVATLSLALSLPFIAYGHPRV